MPDAHPLRKAPLQLYDHRAVVGQPPPVQYVVEQFVEPCALADVRLADVPWLLEGGHASQDGQVALAALPFELSALHQGFLAMRVYWSGISHLAAVSGADSSTILEPSKRLPQAVLGEASAVG